ncbi:FAD-binding, type 2 [Moorella glycerini]|uniref:Carbon monoxide dehydrogenase medium chain n=1 Tax=Neomoorella stamsii TaxID=1266720 RepID=A0A9X7J361_9FIRM|nr:MULTISPECIES: xanthine dehydrogenase family protein subunit M [Moorella]PRR73415.1 Carbon monoxide dehydrogenase medium chain [Moorella stamsii]CEP69184.1 FAD-binding, type 2 [Moorella glycerini]
MNEFAVLRPSSLREALNMKAKYGKRAKVLAGGTDLVVQLKRKNISTSVLIDISRLDELRFVKVDGHVIRIGTLTSHSKICSDPSLMRKAEPLCEACAQIGSPQIRNRGTIGGNLVNASPAADSALALLALGAEFVIESTAGQRIIPAQEFFLGPGETALRENELLTEIKFKALEPTEGGAFFKLGRRNALAISIASAAAWVKLSADFRVVEEAKVCLGAVAPVPLRAVRTEEMLKGVKVDSLELRDIEKSATEESSPITDIRSSAQYRRMVVGVLARRAVESALRRAAGQIDAGVSGGVVGCD